MDKSLRNHLYNAVVKCRRLLEEDMARQLEGAYGIHLNGHIEPLAGMKHLDAVGQADRQAIEATIAHFEMSDAGSTPKAKRTEAIARYLRESAFTRLNQLAALKLMEQPDRQLIQPSVGAAEQSKGFAQFSMVAPQALRGQPDGGYQLYLSLLTADLSHALGVLFDPTLPTALIFPSQPCLQNVLTLLNHPDLAPAWSEDETIGWIYQYFTPGELREEARKASGAPRNSHELSFRNQFYTPRYVVAFLADNSLGRLWWQLRGGDTALAHQCQYLIQDLRLENDDTIDDPIVNPESEIVNQKRDPRTLRILDPASGSGHFLLYCFDLLLTIYREAYTDPDLGPALQADYPNQADFERALPGLILSRNLHGIDIDRRAAQIASLALWLRGHRAHAEAGLKPRQRPRLPLPHIVCAEPMPGEYDLLGEFARDLTPVVLGHMLKDIWDKMKLAGEAGSLLKIEQEISAAVTRARQNLQHLPEGIQLTMFEPATPQQLALPMRRAELDDAEFWANAVPRLQSELRRFAHTASANVTRQLFTHDALQGLALIDLLQQPFDVVLMNPPFGAASLPAKDYITRAYPRTKNDLYAAFVERGLELLRPGGYLGAITSRTGFFLTSFQKWREEILLQESRLITLADLGYGVLDTAMVETAAYVLEKH